MPVVLVDAVVVVDGLGKGTVALAGVGTTAVTASGALGTTTVATGGALAAATGTCLTTAGDGGVAGVAPVAGGEPVTLEPVGLEVGSLRDDRGVDSGDGLIGRGLDSLDEGASLWAGTAKGGKRQDRWGWEEVVEG